MCDKFSQFSLVLEALRDEHQHQETLLFEDNNIDIHEYNNWLILQEIKRYNKNKNR